MVISSSLDTGLVLQFIIKQSRSGEIMEQAIRRTSKSDITQTAASKKFRNYKKETEKATRKTSKGYNITLRTIADTFEKYLQYSFDDALRDSDSSGSSSIDEEFYKKAIRMVSVIQYSSSDVEKFSLVLSELVRKICAKKKIGYRKEKAGMFLNALINCGKDKTYTIHTIENGEDITWFGYRNRKEIMVLGDVGDYFANRMEGGLITVNGNVHGDMGQDMRDGEVIITGNAGSVGYELKGGKITIEGNANKVGQFSAGGEIHINGDLTRRIDVQYDMIGASIYQKGKQIR